MSGSKVKKTAGNNVVMNKVVSSKAISNNIFITFFVNTSNNAVSKICRF